MGGGGKMDFSFISHWGEALLNYEWLGQGMFLPGLSFPIAKQSRGPYHGFVVRVQHVTLLGS